MTKPVIITADSACDLSAVLLEKYQIITIPLTIVVGEQSFQDGIDFQPDDIYACYHEKKMLPKTAAISPMSYSEFFREFAEAGFAVVHISISANISSTYQNACVAASEMEDVYIVDSRHLSAGEALAAIEGCRLRDAGLEAHKIAAELEDFTQRINSSFVLDTLEFMWKGGRCSGVTAMGANLLKLRPCLEMRDGCLRVCKKYRGSIHRVYVQYILDRLSSEKVQRNICFIAHSSELSDNEIDSLKRHIRKCAPFDEINVIRAGCAVSSHCGPGALGVFFVHEL